MPSILTFYSKNIKWITKQFPRIFIILNGLLLGSETLTIPFSFSYGVGFEEASTEWALAASPYPLLSQHYEQCKFLLLQAQGGFLKRDVWLSLSGNYGIFGKGEIENRFRAQEELFLPSEGSLSAGAFTLGYFISLTPDRPSRSFLIPHLGYASDWLKLNSCLSSLSQKWYGPFLGGELDIHTHDGLIVLLNYHYHWLTLHQTLALVKEPSKTWKSHHAYGHEAKVGIQTYLYQKIKIGASLHYLYYRKTQPSLFSCYREDLSIVLEYCYDF
jgi:hypothetical protein